MAEEALIDRGLLHVCGGYRNHFEMHHIVARRGLVTLGARLRDGRGWQNSGIVHLVVAWHWAQSLPNRPT